MTEAWSRLAYVVAASLFIVGLKRMSSPRTAKQGNVLAGVGMAIAIAATFPLLERIGTPALWGGLAVGSLVGALLALRVKMTAMPQMVGMLNGFGGGASALVSGSELMQLEAAGGPIALAVSIPIVLGVLIGAVTFTGSMAAFGKLQELIAGNAVVYPGQQVFNALLGLAIVALSVWICIDPSQIWVMWALMALSSVLGVLLVIPIGGADMPVVISLLNSYSGLAGCATGFAINNEGLVISGSLVGASGIILTQIMCKAMNRSLGNVMFGAFGAQASAQAGAAAAAATVRSGSADDAAAILDAAQSVILVPGYGLAVAQAQHAVRDLGQSLASRGIDVRYAIHPVAGRMPGHMNVLLAEADVPYELLVEMEEINGSFPHTDVALVVGANDVTNPAAREDRSSPIYGMPILDVDKAKTCIVIKRSMNPGFAGIDNPLYGLPRTMMLFGDAKGAVEGIVKALKDA
jgi:NAD(P) transhydrogenase subunit beta